MDRRLLLEQEHAIATHLAANGVPVATPQELYLSDSLDVLVSDFVDDDGAGVSGEALGALLARIHSCAAPAMTLVAQEGLPTEQVLLQRFVRRWKELARIEPRLRPMPSTSVLAARLPAEGGRSLLHLDVRAANVRCFRRDHPVLIDWSNALVGDPGLELARVAEFATMEDNGIELTALLRSYGSSSEDLVAAPAFDVYRLDTALMLALVFRSEAPDPVLGRSWTERADRLATMLVRQRHLPRACHVRCTRPRPSRGSAPPGLGQQVEREAARSSRAGVGCSSGTPYADVVGVVGVVGVCRRTRP